MSGSENSSGNDRAWLVPVAVAFITLVGTLAIAYATIRATQIPIDATRAAEATMIPTKAQPSATILSMETLEVETPTLTANTSVPEKPPPAPTPLSIQVFELNNPENDKTVYCVQGDTENLQLPIDVEHTFLVENGNDLRWTSAFGGFLNIGDPKLHEGKGVDYIFPTTNSPVDTIEIFSGDDRSYICALEIHRVDAK